MVDLERNALAALNSLVAQCAVALEASRLYREEIAGLLEQLNAIRELVATDERSAVVAKERIRDVLDD
jgi:hypothetical protein